MARTNGLEILEALGIIASPAAQESGEDSDTEVDDNSTAGTLRRLKVSTPLLSISSDNK